MNTENLTYLAHKYLLTALEQIDSDLLMETRILNAAYSLGKFYAIMDIWQDVDFDSFADFYEGTRYSQERISKFMENIYKMK